MKLVGQFVFALLANAKQLKRIATSLETISNLYRIECANRGVNLFDPKADGEVEMSWSGGGVGQTDGRYEGDGEDESTEEFYQKLYGEG